MDETQRNKNSKFSFAPMQIEPALLTIPQVCAYLNISRAEFYKINTGAFGLLPIRLGTCRKVLYSRTELEAYIKASTIAGKSINRQHWQTQKKEFMK